MPRDPYQSSDRLPETRQAPSEASDLELLHALSTELMAERDVAGLYEKILDAAVAITQSQFASMQELVPRRDMKSGLGALRLLAAHGYSPEAKEHFEWVGPDSKTSCGISLTTRDRTIIADVEKFAPLAGTDAQRLFLQSGIRSMQTTPLKSRKGDLLGMITTHWANAHEPSARDLRLMDILARQAADILERTKAEEALQESEARLRLALDGAELATWDLDLKSGNSTWNPRHYEMQGYGEDVKGSLELWSDRVHPGDRARVLAGFESAKVNRSLYDEEYRIIRHDTGEERWIGSYGRFHYDADGAAERFSGVSQDITDRKKIEEEAHRSASFLQSVFAASGDCIKVCDREGAILYVNERGLCLLEAESFEKLRGKRWPELWPAESKIDVENAMRTALAGGTGLFTGYCPTAKGSPRWWDVIVTCAVDAHGNPERLIAVSRDVTEKRQADLAFQKSNAISNEALRELEQTYAQSPVGMVQLDTDLRYVRINDQLAAMNGISAADHIGKTIFEVIPALAPKIEGEFRRVIETGEPVIDIEVEGETSADPGKPRVWLESWFPLKDANGAVVGVNVVAQDITERKRHEQMQLMLTGELNHRVKNMLATVQAVATQTLRHNPNPVNFVESFGGRIQSMSRLHSMLSEANWLSADLRDVIRDQIISGPPDDTRVTAWGPSVDLQPQLATQLAMILHELGTNSIKYGALGSADGAVSVSWTVHDGVLNLHWTERGGPPARAPTRRGFGTALIEQSAKSVGGKAEMLIEAHGIGWRINVPLPLSATAMRRNAEADSASSPDGAVRPGERESEQRGAILAGTRFLVVEDEPLVSLEAVDALEESGAAFVATAGTVNKALSLIERERFDAALLDGNLAGQRVDAIAAALTAKNVRFAFVTGYSRDSLPEAYRSAAVLPKPFSRKQLLDMAGSLVRAAANVHQLRK